MLNVDLSVLVTVLYVIILYLFLSRFFFRPIVVILQKRRELIEGRLEESRRRLAIVEQKTTEYEKGMSLARTEVYRNQELQRERALADKAELLTKAKGESERAVGEARARLTAEAEAARKKMAAEVDSLADKLAASILRD